MFVRARSALHGPTSLKVIVRAEAGDAGCVAFARGLLGSTDGDGETLGSVRAMRRPVLLSGTWGVTAASEHVDRLSFRGTSSCAFVAILRAVLGIRT